MEHRQNPKSVMVWAGICAAGKTTVGFVYEGVKIDQSIHRRDILDAVEVSLARRHFGRQKLTLQQDSAPAHRPKAKLVWNEAHFPDVITSAEWPPC